MGFNLLMLLRHFFLGKGRDFVEMCLHHLVALGLYGTCYMINVLEIGAIIAFLHDFSDVFVNLSRVFSDTKYENVTAFCFLTMLVTWLYARMIALPYCIYKLWYSPMDMGNLGRHCFCYLLSCLVLLHYHWYTLFMKMLYKLVLKGETDDGTVTTIVKDSEEEKNSNLNSTE